MSDATLEKAQSDLAEAKATIEKNAADLAKAQADLADLQKRATLSDATREHLAALEKADGEKAKAFLDMKEEDRKKECEKAAAGDETVVIEGRTISKRAVGDDMFTIMKAQASRIDANEKEIAKAREAEATATFEKRATVDFPHLAGTPAERGAVLKYLDAAPADVKKAAETILTAAEGFAKFAFQKAGTRSDPNAIDGAGAEAEIAKGARELLKAQPALGTFEKAYDAFLQTPEGAALFDKSLAEG